ncbi:MAG: response regulator [Candidatus Omnitrophica bacterium]|nr:response regulator [Candidatus Omnitrophota bacterium]
MSESFHDPESSVPLDVLLIEDNEADIKITLRAFQKADLKTNVYVARDGKEALDFLKHEGDCQNQEECPRPDLILLDINMPKMTGEELLKNIKGQAALSHIPIVVLTSSKRPEDILNSYKNGAASYIQKPIDYDEFTDYIKSFNYYWHVVAKLPDREMFK